VLDRLLEDGRVSIDGICGTSAGAMNAVLVAHGLMHGGRDGARATLADFWGPVSRMGAQLNPLAALAAAQPFASSTPHPADSPHPSRCHHGRASGLKLVALDDNIALQRPPSGRRSVAACSGLPDLRQDPVKFVE
jgi:hypothetical protein